MQQAKVDGIDREVSGIAFCEISGYRPANAQELNNLTCEAFEIFVDSAAYQIMGELARLIPFEEIDEQR